MKKRGFDFSSLGKSATESKKKRRKPNLFSPLNADDADDNTGNAIDEVIGRSQDVVSEKIVRFRRLVFGSGNLSVA